MSYCIFATFWVTSFFKILYFVIFCFLWYGLNIFRKWDNGVIQKTGRRKYFIFWQFSVLKLSSWQFTWIIYPNIEHFDSKFNVKSNSCQKIFEKKKDEFEMVHGGFSVTSTLTHIKLNAYSPIFASYHMSHN